MLADDAAAHPACLAARERARRHPHRAAAASGGRGVNRTGDDVRGSVAEVVPLRRHRFRMANLAAAAVVWPSSGSPPSSQPWRDQPGPGVSQAGVADRVMAAADAKHVKVSFPDGATATVIRSEKLGKAVLVTEGMPAAPAGKVYELWLRNSVGRWSPAGLMRAPATSNSSCGATPRTPTPRHLASSRPVGSKEPTNEPIALVRLRPGRRMTPPTTLPSWAAASPDCSRRTCSRAAQGDALRGRHPARRPCRHPRRSSTRASEFAIDTGFIVHNLRTYPHLLRLFDELGVATQDSEMSMSVRADERRWRPGVRRRARAGSGLFPTWRNALRPSYLRMLAEIPRFHRMAKRLARLRSDAPDDDQTLGSSSSAGRLLAAVPHALHGVAGGLRVVLRPGGGAGVPRALPVPLPGAPRDARRLRLAAVAHGHRRLARVRHPGRERLVAGRCAPAPR